MSCREENISHDHCSPDAVIFDLDGVLVTTDSFHFRGWKRLADELGMKFTEEDNHRLRGVSRVESLKIIYRLNGRELPLQEEFEEQMTRKNGYYIEFIKQMKPDDVLPGSVKLLKELRSSRIKCAIASSSKNTALVLEKTGLVQYVDAIADGTMIRKSKPDPEVFLLAACKCDCLPWNCVGIEDAAAGVESIKRAGMVCVGIGEQAKESELVVDSVSELNCDSLCNLYRRKKKTPDPSLEKAFEKICNSLSSPRS